TLKEEEINVLKFCAWVQQNGISKFQIKYKEGTSKMSYDDSLRGLPNSSFLAHTKRSEEGKESSRWELCLRPLLSLKGSTERSGTQVFKSSFLGSSYELGSEDPLWVAESNNNKIGFQSTDPRRSASEIPLSEQGSGKKIISM
ncbi:UDP-3-O-acylglucosamine N-acyltransferase, partial [Striga asiatica]